MTSSALRLPPSALEIDPASETERIVSAVRQQVLGRLRRKGAVLGLSGGIDSSVAAALCVRALGAERVVGLLMPERDSSPDSLGLGRLVAEHLGIRAIVEDVSGVLEAAGCYRRRDRADARTGRAGLRRHRRQAQRHPLPARKAPARRLTAKISAGVLRANRVSCLLVDQHNQRRPEVNLWEKAHVVHRAWRFRLKSERPEILFLLEHLAVGQIALDIGAHKGAYAWWMAKRVGPAGKVIAFEPQSGLAGYLDEIKAAFRFEQLTVVRAALSSSEGTRDLFQPAVNPRGGATLEKMATEGTTVSAAAITLDKCLDEHSARPVRFIKCDVEGHELEVFRGGGRMLREDRPVLLFECQEFRHPEGQTKRVFEYLFDLGYEGYFFEKGRPAPISQFRVEVHQQGPGPLYRDNFAFLPGSRAKCVS